MSFLDVLLGRKHPPLVGLDISSSSVKLVELGQFGIRSTMSSSDLHQKVSKRAGSPTVKSKSSMKWPTQCAGWSSRAVRAPSMWRWRMPQSAVITKKIMLPAGALG